LQTFTKIVKERFPDVVLIAEENTGKLPVTLAPENSGLGFDFKWESEEVQDFKKFYQMDPIYRKWHFDLITNLLNRVFEECNIFAFTSKDFEPYFYKLWGDEYNKIASLRNIMTFVSTLPGKKLWPMGIEIASRKSWLDLKSIDWSLLEERAHSKHQSSETSSLSNDNF